MIQQKERYAIAQKVGQGDYVPFNVVKKLCAKKEVFLN